VPLAQWTRADMRREFYSSKSCAPKCTISCVQQTSYIDHWRAPQTQKANMVPTAMIRPVPPVPAPAQPLVELGDARREN
jgi:hypothetical protein